MVDVAREDSWQTGPSELAPEWLSVPRDWQELDRTVWPEAFGRGDSGELTVSGLSAAALAETYGTPLYVVSEDTFRARAREFRDAFDQAFEAIGTQVSVYYAGKSFLTPEVVRWVREEGLNLDTASGGEMSCGMRGGMDPARMALHGNNKSAAEITRALDAGVGRIVVDSLPEIELVGRLARTLGVTAPVMLRVTPGIHAETHDFIATAHEDQKFGLSLAPPQATDVQAQDALSADGQSSIADVASAPSDAAAPVGDGVASAGESVTSAAMRAVSACVAHPNLDLQGIHCHIGSQIFAAEGFAQAAERVLTFMAEVRAKFGVQLPQLDLGGGYGIAYTEADRPRPAQHIAEALAAAVRDTCQRLEFPVPHLSFEPGRSIVGPAGITLYTVGTMKAVTVKPGQSRRYVSVDGGMSDNPRPVLYGADYSAVVADSTSGEGTAAPVFSRVVGKHCESGDVVVNSTYLPADLAAGDLLAVPATGAYCWALSSNYNWLPRPTVVAVSTTSGEPQARVMVRGETEDDLFARMEPSEPTPLA
ncbi:diaminopimelate decarboxylase family protein [Kocuria sp.]|uniref:diaminopimelate decarboxylase family protein n=1 Tax=Kocuria sp. TaxID=1871328 RepID=UPI0026E0D075|nr:diaminopimelate decarboxylase [Kocuria sp.]MDO5618392.1 diaminopimelate decarboxylase [Kocuria sp.]